MGKNINNSSNEDSIWAAGGVIIKSSNRERKVVICFREKENLWSLPKGKPENGETITQTAIREVREETGIDTDILEKIATIDYIFLNNRGTTVKKKVHFFLMKSKGGNIEYHDNEFDKVTWVNLEDAKHLLTHKNELHVLEKAIEMVLKK